MLLTIVSALYYFLPSYAANAAPVLFNKLGWMKFAAKPIDGGLKLGGQDLFGHTKTYRGIISGVITAEFIILIQYVLDATGLLAGLSLIKYELPMILLLGLLLGLGEGLGDLIKSFIKRRIGIQSSKPFFPFDQLSFLGSLLLSFLYFMPPPQIIWTIIIISPLLPVLANIAAYKLGWKKVWW